jgi:hypothetical protein
LIFVRSGTFIVILGSLLKARKTFTEGVKSVSLLAPKAVGVVSAITEVAVNAPEPVAAKTLAARHSLRPRSFDPVFQALVRHSVLDGFADGQHQ